MIMPTKLLLRMPFLVLAGVSLVLLSIPALGLSFSDTFMGMLKVRGDVIGIVFQRELIEAAIRKALAPFAIDFHPAPYWHHAFVLLWLLQGSWVRNMSSGQEWGHFLFIIIWGGLTALVAGAATGTVPLNSWAMIMWPAAGVLAFFAGDLARDAVRGRGSWRSSLSLVGAAGEAAVAAVAAYLGYAFTKPMTSFFGLDVSSPGLLALAGVVGFLGLVMLAGGLSYETRDGDPRFTSMGLDIVGAFGIAAALAIGGQYLL
jgi:hypothetical protein